MSTLVINYNALDAVARNASDLAKSAENYINSLSNKVLNKFDGISGGQSGYTSSAKYYVNAKIRALREKQTSYSNFSTQVTKFAETAKRVDQQVAAMIANNQENFLQKHENLRISEWKAKLLNWLVDLKNSSHLFELIGDALNWSGTELSGLLSNIRYWYKCEGGKEIVNFVLAIGGAILAVALFIAALPASGFIAICGAIGAAIAAVNAITNVFTSFSAMRADDPAWAKIYGDRDKLSDVLRGHNFGNGVLNRFSYGFASLIDGVELFCDAVNVFDTLRKIKSKFSFVQNYFDKNTGLLSYMKTAKWENAKVYDELGNVVEIKKVMKVNEYGIVETRFTPSSVWNGLKAFVLDSPIDCHTDKGIRTLLNNNFSTDLKDWKKSVFNITAWKDTFKYTVTDGGRITYSEWKNSFSFSSFKDTIRYNIKNNSFKGIFADNVSWKNRKDYINSTSKSIKAVNKMATKIGKVVTGEYSFSNDVKSFLEKKVKSLFIAPQIIDEFKPLKEKLKTFHKNTYRYKKVHTTT